VAPEVEAEPEAGAPVETTVAAPASLRALDLAPRESERAVAALLTRAAKAA